MGIGAIVRDLMESRRLTQAELASAVGVTTQTVSAWELENKTPRMGKLKEIADYFDVSVSSIVAGVDKSKEVVTYLFGTLTEEEQKLTLSYMRFLYSQRKQDKK